MSNNGRSFSAPLMMPTIITPRMPMIAREDPLLGVEEADEARIHHEHLMRVNDNERFDSFLARVPGEVAERVSWVPASDIIRFEDHVEHVKSKAHSNAINLIKSLMMSQLRVATAESLTGGMIFSNLVDIPLGVPVNMAAFLCTILTPSACFWV